MDDPSQPIAPARAENSPTGVPAPETAQPLPMPASPSFGGYRLLQPVFANTDGELWLAQHQATGTMTALALLAQDALADPGAIWRFRQELARRNPEYVRIDLLTMNPPQGADDATNLRRIHGGRVGAAPVMSPYVPSVLRKVRTEEQKKKDRKTLWIVAGVVACGLLVFCAFYGAVIYFFFVPSVKWSSQHAKAQMAETNAKRLTDAVNQWASDNAVAPGTPYTWTDISDHVPTYLQETGGPTDPLGNKYYFPPTIGRDVELHPDTKNILDKKEPDFFWTEKP